MNKELLLKVKKHILEEPKRLNMGSWLVEYSEDDFKNNDDLPSCGTVGCIAGWSYILGLNGKPEDMIFNYHETREVLDISEEEANKLFYVDNWPVDFYNKYQYLHDEKFQHRAQVTADRIQHFIDTGE